MSAFLGFDTSNYTTCAAIFDSEAKMMINGKKLLPVGKGEKGLMQSKALFEHIRQLPQVTEAAFSSYRDKYGAVPKLVGIGVSDRPTNAPGSYMPVFLAGVSAARCAAASHGVECNYFSHQQGHIAAALYGVGKLDLLKERFIAFHISGGTTEAVLVTPNKDKLFECKVVARSLDLHAGQVIDRVGVMLGMPFPAGDRLDECSRSALPPKKPQAVMKGCDCCLSGIENQCMKLIEQGTPKNRVAAFAIEAVYAAVAAMSLNLEREYGALPFVYAGGVTRNSLIRARLGKRGIFAPAEYSSDNAAGTAVLTYLKMTEGTI